MFKNFYIKDLFEVINNPQLDKENFTFSESAEYPYFTRTENNNGILGYVEYLDEEHKIKGNSLAVGMISMRFHYMHHDFYAGQFTKTLIPKFQGFNEKLAMYFMAILNKHSEYYQSFLVRHFKDKVSGTVVSLPVIESPDFNHTYTVDDIDFAYMEERIAELEEERIAELEEERVRELEAYLKAAGLSDCELDDGDRQTLRESREREFKDYRITDHFVVKNTHSILKEWVRFGGSRPYVTAGSSDNSVAGYIDYDEPQLEEGNSIMVGGKTTVVTYQPCDYFSNDSHNLAVFPKNSAGRTELAQLFIASALQKSLGAKYSWGDSVSYRKIRKDVVSLPAGSDGEPDFAYMERYTRAIEKLAIADVVKYKDKLIDTTKQLIVGN